MLTFFRRVANSKIGTWVIGLIGLGILAGFALSDLSNFGSGNIGFGMGSNTLAEVGGQKITEDEVSEAMQRRLQQVRAEKPDADYATIMGDFETILNELIDTKTLLAFAEKYRFPLSKRLIDAEIASIPATKGPGGQFSEAAYQQFLQQQHLSDTQVRQVLAGGLLERFMLTPVAANARVSAGMATPYASMLLESREGDAAAIPLGAFRNGLKPSDADLQQYYAANKDRYMVPEQRVLRIARMGPEQVGNITASDQEIAAYYNAHKAQYAAKETRDVTQAVVPDQATANAIAAKVKGGASMADAAGANAAVTTLKDQSPEAYASVGGKSASAAVFAAPSGAVVGPIQTSFGWAVVKVDSVKTKPGKSLDQARAEIAASITADKRKNAVEDLVDKVQDTVDGGSNFTETVAQAKLPVTTTPMITADGRSRSDPSYKVPDDLAPALKTGFELEPNDPPEIVTLPNNEGYALVSPGEVVNAAPAPLTAVHDQVANDWINAKALERARAVATQIEAKVERGTPLAQAVKESGAPLPPVQPLAMRRIQIASAQGQIPAPLKMLFSLGQGKSRMMADPQGRGFFVVKVNKIIPGNAMLQPALIGQMQSELQQGVAEDYARQFLAAMRKQLGAKRNEGAIQAMKARLANNGG
ncbi:MAG: peptidyl-prolyl cis-trans isomerase [Bacillota bacterium]